MMINVDYIKNIITSKKIFIYLIVMFTIGIIMMTISKPSDISKTKLNTETDIKNSDENQKYNLEKKLEEIISSIVGAGKTKVLIIYESANKKAQPTEEREVSDNFIAENKYDNSSDYITEEVNDHIDGVIVVAEGGGDEFWKREVSESLSEVLDIDLHKVRIHKMKIGD